MLDMFFQDGAAWFGVPAMLGTTIFIVRLVLMLAGAHHGGGFHDVHAADPHAADHSDSTGAFKAITFQTIMAFAMGFGWGGLAARHAMHLSFASSAFVGIACGIAMAWILAILMKAMSDLQASGNIPIHEAIGREGEVYVSLPRNGEGRGQVKLVIAERLRIFNAISESEPLPTQSRVRVVRVNPDNTLSVTRA